MENHAWRIFIAIELPIEVRERIAAHVTRLRELVPDAHASWTRPENIHLTLKFLGDTPQTHIDKVSGATSQTVTHFHPFKLGVSGSGAFPPRSTPKVLWIGVSDPEGTLAKLQTRLEEECFRVGVKKESRRFRPHLTLCRRRKPQDARMLAATHIQLQFEPIEFEVSEVSVIRSELSSVGSRYTTISRHPLDEQDSTSLRSGRSE